MIAETMNDDERAAFEAWAKMEFEIDDPLIRRGDGYLGMAIDVAWDVWLGAWQASRAVALEAAWEAVHGERLEEPSKNADDVAYDMAVDDCANAVRTLAKQGESACSFTCSPRKPR